MTNLIASVLITLQTNWVNQTKTVPFCNQGDQCQLQHMQLVKQLGAVQTNVSAKLLFEGREILVLLRSNEELIPSQQREITEVVQLHQQFKILGNNIGQWQGGNLGFIIGQ